MGLQEEEEEEACCSAAPAGEKIYSRQMHFLHSSMTGRLLEIFQLRVFFSFLLLVLSPCCLALTEEEELQTSTSPSFYSLQSPFMFY